MAVGSDSAVAYWNPASGAVWVQAKGRDPVSISRDASDVLAAYDALSCAGYTRNRDWAPVPGMPGYRSLPVIPAGHRSDP